MSPWARTTGLVISMFVASCGEKNDQAQAPDPGAVEEASGCAADTTAQPFSKGMSQVGSNGFEVAIDADPPRPARGDQSTWTLRVTNPNPAEPIPEGTLVKVACAMTHSNLPSHGCAVTPSVKDLGAGEYEVAPIIFNMSGHWQVTVNVGTLDRARFELCIE